MRKLMLTILFGLMVTVTYAQEGNNQLLQKLVEKKVLTQEEANELALEEKTKSAKATNLEDEYLKLKQTINNKYLELGGYALLHYRYDNTRDVKHNGSVRAAFLSIKGEPVDKLSYLVFYSLRQSELFEYYITYAFDDALQLRVGQQKTPISIENQLSLTVLELIQNGRTLDNLLGGGTDVSTLQNGKNNTGRDLGIKVYGDLFQIGNRALIEYGLGIYQGSGINSGAKRNDKDFTANVLVSPFKGFRIGGGVYFGQAVYAKNGAMSDEEHVRNRWLISTDYKSDRFSARAEYVRGNDGGIGREGVYGLASWNCVPNKWVAIAKVEYYNSNTKIGREAMDYTAGINYHLTKTCRVQTNYTYSDYSRKWGNRNSHVVEAQFQIVY